MVPIIALMKPQNLVSNPSSLLAPLPLPEHQVLQTMLILISHPTPHPTPPHSPLPKNPSHPPRVMNLNE